MVRRHLSHHLVTPRWRHTAWRSREGVLLIGGSSTASYGTDAPLTADKLTDGKSEIHKGFAAPSLGSCIIHISDNKILLINDKTSIFNSTGFVQALTGLHPDFPRQQYGCGYYKNSENKEVSLFLFVNQRKGCFFTWTWSWFILGVSCGRWSGCTPTWSCNVSSVSRSHLKLNLSSDAALLRQVDRINATA